MKIAGVCIYEIINELKGYVTLNLASVGNAVEIMSRYFHHYRCS